MAGQLENLKKSDFLSTSKAAMELDTSVQTLTRWYRWWEDDNFKKAEGLYLPPYFHMDRRLTKFFRKDDMHHLFKFKEQLQSTHRGAMADFNAEYQWGARGIKALRNRDMLDENTGRMKRIKKIKKGDKK